MVFRWEVVGLFEEWYRVCVVGVWVGLREKCERGFWKVSLELGFGEFLRVVFVRAKEG